MHQTTTEYLCVLSENGFEISGIFQETPYLKEFCESQGFTIHKFSKNGKYILCKGFREEMLKEKSKFRPFFYDGKKIPREYRPFFSIITPQLYELDYRIEHFKTLTPFDDITNLIKSDDTDNEFFDLQFRHIKTGIKLIEKISKDRVKEPFDLLIETFCILGEFYHLEALLLASKRDQEFFKNLPRSDLCPTCLEPMEDPKDLRSSEICKKCRREIRMQKQREKRGTQIIGERSCACGCGEIITGAANKKYINATHGRRVQKR
jgi:hypothetical protein